MEKRKLQWYDYEWEGARQKEVIETVFVYGTLKEGYGNHGLLHKAIKVSNATTCEKYGMYESGIPYVIKDQSKTTIKGEVYLVDGMTFDVLDSLEGHPVCYKREKIKVLLDNNKKTTAWIYFYPNQCGREISDGVYKLNY
jgi:gamma-glutamylaminecyclotransferase